MTISKFSARSILIGAVALVFMLAGCTTASQEQADVPEVEHTTITTNPDPEKRTALRDYMTSPERNLPLAEAISQYAPRILVGLLDGDFGPTRVLTSDYIPAEDTDRRTGVSYIETTNDLDDVFVQVQVYYLDGAIDYTEGIGGFSLKPTKDLDSVGLWAWYPTEEDVRITFRDAETGAYTQIITAEGEVSVPVGTKVIDDAEGAKALNQQALQTLEENMKYVR